MDKYPNSPVDVIKDLTRWNWLVIVGAGVGLGVGYALFAAWLL